MPAPAARPVLLFARTPAGEQCAQRGAAQLPGPQRRLLMLLESPLTVAEIGAIVATDDVPESLIALERQRFVHRPPPAPASARSAAAAVPPPVPAGARRAAATAPLPEVVAHDWRRSREHVRSGFERLLGSLGEPMGDRVARCASADELDALMPQVEALLEAIAGHEAAGRFRESVRLPAAR